MTRAVLFIAALLAYGAALSVPYAFGDDPGFVFGLVVPLLAHVMLGAVVRRPWVLVVPVGVALVFTLIAYDEDALVGLGGIILGIVGVGLTSFGIVAGLAITGAFRRDAENGAVAGPTQD